MENATKRMRKARRQGLAGGKNLAPTTRANLTSAGMDGQDNPATPRANARRKTLVSSRKTKRNTRRGTASPAKRKTIERAR